MINRTWPHPEHTLRSLAQPGGGIAPMVLSCMREYITFQVDVFLLELDVTGGSYDQMSKLLVHLVRDQWVNHMIDPLVLIVNFVSIARRTGPPSVPNLHLYTYNQIIDVDKVSKRLGYPVFNGMNEHPLISSFCKAT